jgi:hypothetical protein
MLLFDFVLRCHPERSEGSLLRSNIHCSVRVISASDFDFEDACEFYERVAAASTWHPPSRFALPVTEVIASPRRVS